MLQPEHEFEFLTGDAQCAAIAAAVTGIDLRSLSLPNGLGYVDIIGKGGSAPARAIYDTDPHHWRTALAHAARSQVDGRWRGDESEMLVLLAHMAIQDGDLDRARYLNETIEPRNPATVALYRHNLIHIDGLPLETMRDESHHLEVTAQLRARVSDETRAFNRLKMLDEANRLLA